MGSNPAAARMPFHRASSCEVIRGLFCTSQYYATATKKEIRVFNYSVLIISDDGISYTLFEAIHRSRSARS